MSIITANPPFAGTQVGDKTIMANQMAGLTNEAKINAAIARAVAIGALYVYVPANMLPYNASLVTFNPAVRMVREGGEADTYDVHAYGATGNGIADDGVAINSAITQANLAHPGTVSGQIVVFDALHYATTIPIVVPVGAGVTTGAVILQGKGKRSTYIYPIGPATNFAQGTIRLGTATPENSGTSNLILYYCGVRDMSVNGSLMTGNGGVGIAFVETQRCHLQHCIIENFNGTGEIGLWLLGSTTTGGISANAVPHCWRCHFQDVTVATTTRPLVVQNGDENDFWTCNFAVPTGLGAIAADSIIAVEIVQGRNNGWHGLLCSGDDSNLTPNVAFQCDQPVQGDVIGNQAYRVVAEGFDIIFNITGTSASANQMHGLNAAVFNTLFNNAGFPAAATDPRNLTVFFAPLHNVWYVSGTPGPLNNGHAITLALGNQTIDITKMDVVYLTGNAGGSAITSLTTTAQGATILEGREVWFKFSDALVTVIDASQTGGNNIRLWGRQNVTGCVDGWLGLKCTGGTWYQVAPLVNNTLTAAYGIPTGIVHPLVNKTANYNAATSDFYILCDPSGGAFNVTLLNAVGNRGLEVVVKHKSASGNNITVNTAGGNIDGAASKTLTSLQSARFTSDGTNWFTS